MFMRCVPDGAATRSQFSRTIFFGEARARSLWMSISLDERMERYATDGDWLDRCGTGMVEDEADR